MVIQTSSFIPGRRKFFLDILPAGALLCFGWDNLLTSAQHEEKRKVLAKKHKFLEDSGMSFKEVYAFAFEGHLIPLMRNLEKDIGEKELIQALKKASSEASAQMMKKRTESLSRRDFEGFKAFIRIEDPILEHVLTHEVVRETENVIEVRVTECLWAKTFREADAADIGYAALCYGDYAAAHAFNPEIRLIRTETLMQGNDCCKFRYVWGG